MRALKCLALALVLGALPEAAMAQSEVIESFSMTDIGELMDSIGGTMSEVSEGEEPGDLEAFVTYASGDTAFFRAMNCEAGEMIKQRQCAYFSLTKAFEMKSAKAAEALSLDFDAAWYADLASENWFIIRRMDWISNGVTRQHLGAALFEFSEGISNARRAVAEADRR